MERVLIVGENPYNGTGNGNMLASMISKLDTTKYDPTLFLVDKTDISLIESVKHLNEFPIITANEHEHVNIWGHNRLVHTIKKHEFDSILFVGLDVWKYHEIFDYIEDVQNYKGLKWYSLIPYDLPYIRKDWLQWINRIQYPFVYSEFAYDLLKPSCPKIQFFRPEPHMHTLFQNYNDMHNMRKKMFSTNMTEDTVLFGFIGANQMRKNIGNIIKGFSLFINKFPNVKAILYMHTEDREVWDIYELSKSYQIPKDRLIIKPQNLKVSQNDVPLLYNMCDCIVNPTIQEGLSWTVIEALLCGKPVIVSDSTAHKDYIQTEQDYLISLLPTATSFLHLMTEDGPRLIESERAVEAEAIAEGMQVYLEMLHGNDYSYLYKQSASRWMSKCSNINKLLSFEEDRKEGLGEWI